ncbi:MAG: DNA-3-methyladenine glycosylase [Cyanobacteria bacterium J06554_11]
MAPSTTGPKPLSSEWFSRPSTQVAPDLLGCQLLRKLGNEVIRGQIVETEAYEAGDPAMYAYQRKTERNAAVFGPAGIIYIYRIYRQYHCFNIVTDREGFASTILIRAVHLDHRPSWVVPKKTPAANSLEKLAAGPGKLCIALALDESFRGLSASPETGIWVEAGQAGDSASGMTSKATSEVVQTTRIGLSRGQDIPWRWYLRDSPAVSKR